MEITLGHTYRWHATTEIVSSYKKEQLKLHGSLLGVKGKGGSL